MADGHLFYLDPDKQWDLAYDCLDLLRFSGELFAHCRPAISNWTGLPRSLNGANSPRESLDRF